MPDKYITIGGDMTVNKPCPMQYASCILTRYDNGVSNQQKARTGVLLKKARKGFNNESDTSFKQLLAK